MDCTEEQNKPVCGQFEVKGFPTVIYFPADEAYKNQWFKHKGVRTIESFDAFATSGYAPSADL